MTSKDLDPTPRAFSTRVLHVDTGSQVAHGALITPIYQTTTFEFESCDEAADLFALKKQGYMYGRTSNPTNAALEQRLALLEDGVGAITAASGKAALMLAVFAIAGAGDNIVSSRMLYGGTYAAFTATLAQMGIEVRFAECDDPEAFLNAADGRTRMFYGETLSNPTLQLFPITEVAKAGATVGIPLLIDNTLTPGLVAPIREGAAATILSCSKYVAGQGAVLGGALVIKGGFDWQGSAERFPLLTSPDPAYNGEIWSHVATRLGVDPMLLRARYVVLRDLGATLSPHSAFLVSQGLETLTLRMQHHSSSAAIIANWLAQQPGVAQVTYPGVGEPLPAALINGAGGMIGLELDSGSTGGRILIQNLDLFAHVPNNGDARSLAIHPASTMLAQLSEEQRAQTGVPDSYVRLCIGLEDPNDLINDLSRALALVRETTQ